MNYEILKLQFWFQLTGPASLVETLITGVVFVVVFLLGILVLLYNSRLAYPPKAKFLKPLGLGLLVFGLFGMVFVPLRALNVQFLGVRFFPLLFFVSALAWTSYFSLLYKRQIQNEILNYESRQLKKKYLNKK